MIWPPNRVHHHESARRTSFRWNRYIHLRSYTRQSPVGQ